MSDEQDKWIPIAEAATETGLPVRTIYNWVRSGSVTSRKEDGVVCVVLEEVRAKAQKREKPRATPALLPAASAGTGLPASVAGTDATQFLDRLPSEARSALPIEVLAYLIRLFEQGVSLQSIVEQLRLPPLLAIEARRQYELLVTASGQPSIQDRGGAVEEHVQGHLASMEAMLERRLAAMEARILSFEDFCESATTQKINQLCAACESRHRGLDRRIDRTEEQLEHKSRLVSIRVESQEKLFETFTHGILDLLRQWPK